MTEPARPEHWGSTEREVLDCDRAWEDAIIHSDSVEMDRLAANELVYTHASSLVDDKSAFINHIINGQRRYLAIDYEDVGVRLHQNTAVVTCALHLQTVDNSGSPGELHFRTTHVWVRSERGWRLLANQSTHIPRA